MNLARSIRLGPVRLWPALLPLALFTLLAAPGTALADCLLPPPVQDALTSADSVFVGTVTATTNRDTWANVTVEEVWKGRDQPASVIVHGGPGGNAGTSVDRTFEVGTKYLFFPYVDERLGLADNSCTSTQPWGAGLLPFRPANVRAPTGAAEGAGFDIGGVVGPLVVAIVVGALLLGAGMLARGRDSG
jgi:hypothetical protein